MNGLQYSWPVLANRKLEMRHCSTPKLKAKQCNGWGWHGNRFGRTGKEEGEKKRKREGARFAFGTGKLLGNCEGS